MKRIISISLFIFIVFAIPINSSGEKMAVYKSNKFPSEEIVNDFLEGIFQGKKHFTKRIFIGKSQENDGIYRLYYSYYNKLNEEPGGLPSESMKVIKLDTDIWLVEIEYKGESYLTVLKYLINK